MPIEEIPFLVDRYKHRIVKREGVWRLYCPERGTNDIIYCVAPFPFITVLLEEPCPHETVPARFSSGWPANG